MSIVHGINSRTSLDLDFSLETDFENLDDVRSRISKALANRFAATDLIPFDISMAPRPDDPDSARRSPRWGGYQLEFKLATPDRYQTLKNDLQRLRRESVLTGPGQLRRFRVDFSKWEFTAGKAEAELDHYTIFVYTPAMIAVEKVRAICQQMEEYVPARPSRSPRARDFYDIHNIVTKTGLRFDSLDCVQLLQEVFAAKQVPLNLIASIAKEREYHRADWPSVRSSAIGPLEEFDYYFDFVLLQLRPLHALWME